MTALPGSAEGTAVTGLDSSPVQPAPADLPPLTDQARLEAREIIARYPQKRSALLPMLHLVQSYQGYVSPEGVAQLLAPASPPRWAKAVPAPMPFLLRSEPGNPRPRPASTPNSRNSGVGASHAYSAAGLSERQAHSGVVQA